VQGDAGDAADQPIGQSGRDLAQPQVVLAITPPTRYQIQVLVDQAFDHVLDVFGIVLQIAVHHHDDLATGVIDAGLHGGGLTEVAL
jgi:hypothetical protein